MEPLRIPVIMQPPSYRKDSSAMLKFETNELTESDREYVFKYMNKYGWLIFSENEVQDSEIPKMPAPIEGKSPSQRLHSVLFIYWKQVKNGEGDFDTYYRATMEKLIDNFKGKLL